MNHPATRPQARRRSARAFTIAEIIVVVVIIGILATIVATRLLPKITQSKVITAGANAATVANAVTAYIGDCGSPPAGTALADFLMVRPSNVSEEAWQGPYLQNSTQLLDPWGHTFVMVFPGVKNADFDIVSYGGDGQPGGDGENKDIVKP
ncbi:MAG: type II secretion system major pseudopilin GspG [Phycisphaerales bacterium]|nr:type II secretion system major pseudopilin GspG [Phycisphaerales bacterium]